MFRVLVRNTGVTAVAFFAVSVVGILLVPLLIGTYGLVAFGLITLARTFLPSAALAILDFGFSEVTTQAVARARSRGDWVEAGRIVRRVTVFAILVGLGAALVLALGAPFLAQALRTPPAEMREFTWILVWTGASLLLLFPSMVGDGVLKGMDAYPALRAAEVTATLAYAALTVALVFAGFGYASVAYAYLAVHSVRAVVTCWYAWRLVSAAGLVLAPADDLARAFVFERCRLMIVNKLVGVGQTQAPPVLIGFLIGPTGVAVYDVISRLPRLTKSVLGVLNAGLLPVASRLDASADTSGFAKLGDAGLLLVAFAVLPPLFALAAFSDRVLALWVAPEFAVHGAWTGALFAATAVQALLSFAGAMMMVDPAALARINRLGLVQIAVTYVVAFVALPFLAERAFVLGQVVGIAIAVPTFARLLTSLTGLDAPLYRRLAAVVATGLAVVALRFWPEWHAVTFGPVALVVALVAACLAQWLFLYHSVLTANHRRWARTVVATLAGRAGGRT